MHTTYFGVAKSLALNHVAKNLENCLPSTGTNHHKNRRLLPRLAATLSLCLPARAAIGRTGIKATPNFLNRHSYEIWRRVMRDTTAPVLNSIRLSTASFGLEEQMFGAI